MGKNEELENISLCEFSMFSYITMGNARSTNLILVNFNDENGEKETYKASS